jgi:hypothetical protein
MGMFDNPNPTPEMVDQNQDGQGQSGADQNQQTQQAQSQTQGQDGTAQQGQVNDQQQPQEGQLLAGQFKDPAALEKAYLEQKKLMGKMSGELGQLRKAQPQQAAQQTQPQQQEAGWTDQQWMQFNQQFQQNLTKNPGKAVFDLIVDVAQQMINPLQETIQTQTQSKAVSQAVDSEIAHMIYAVGQDGQPIFPEADSMIQDIQDTLAKYPFLAEQLAQQGMMRQSGQMADDQMGVLEMLYKAVKADKVEALAKTAFNNGLQQGANNLQSKKGATLPNLTTKTQNNNSSPEEQVVSEIFAHRKGGYFG